jgi:hypothetical protein
MYAKFLPLAWEFNEGVRIKKKVEAFAKEQNKKAGNPHTDEEATAAELTSKQLKPKPMPDDFVLTEGLVIRGLGPHGQKVTEYCAKLSNGPQRERGDGDKPAEGAAAAGAGAAGSAPNETAPCTPAAGDFLSDGRVTEPHLTTPYGSAEICVIVNESHCAASSSQGSRSPRCIPVPDHGQAQRRA